MVQTSYREIHDRPGRTRRSDGSLQSNGVLGISGSNTRAHTLKQKHKQRSDSRYEVTEKPAAWVSHLSTSMLKKWPVGVID